MAWITSDEPQTLTPQEEEEMRLGTAEIARGDYVTLEELRRELDLEPGR